MSAPRLVVIDPEDREQVERLADALTNARQGHPYGYAYPGEIDNMRDALRSLIARPEPEEPTGLGAVVEDVEGLTWVRYSRIDDADGTWACGDRSINNREYAEIDVVRVLSEGWRA